MKIAAWLLGIYILLGIILYFTQERFLFQGVKLHKDYQYQFDELNYTENNITRADGSNLHYLKLFPADTFRKGVVLYFHGNKENVKRYVPNTPIMIMSDYEVWMMDYPGFGKTTGKLSEQQLYEDAQRLYDTACNYFEKNQILIYGKSLGTGLASYIASKNDCFRLVLETPYYNLPSVYQNFVPIYPAGLMLKYQFPIHQYLNKVTVPITIFHGSDDEIIKIKNAERLKSTLKPIDEFVTIPKAKHNNIRDFQLYIDKLDSVLSL